MYVYRKSDYGVYTAGFFSPEGEWIAESDHPSRGMVAARVHYLNGGVDAEVFGTVFDHLCNVLLDVNTTLNRLLSEVKND